MSQTVNSAGLVPLPKCQNDSNAMSIFQVLTRLACHDFLTDLTVNDDLFFGDL